MKNLIIFLALTVLVFSCSENKRNEAVVEKKPKVVEIELTDEEIIQEGKTIAKASFGAMKAKLMSAMKTGGVEKAASFCHTNAISITDSLSKHYNVEIKRTSLKLRNKNNKPTEKEEKVLNDYGSAFATNKNVKPMLKRNENTIDFYAPIMIGGACIKCHGILGETMKETDYSKIKALYPQDEAIGYALSDYRGIWHITFKK